MSVSRKHFLYILTGLFLIQVTSCWQEQYHGIVPPTLPNYPVMGKILSSADGTPVEGAIVLLDAENAGITTDTTDSTGSFYLDHVQGGKSYSLTVTKDYFQLYSQSVAVAYDTVEVDDISLGKIYYHINMYDTGLLSSFTPQGLVWRGSNLWSVDSSKSWIIVHNYDSYMSVKKKYNLPRYPIPYRDDFSVAPLGLEWHQNNLLTFDDQKDKSYILTPTAGDTVLILTSYTLPDDVASFGDLWDFTWDGHQLWSCSPGEYGFSSFQVGENPEDDVIVKHDHDLSVSAIFTASEIDEGIVNPTGIAWDGEKFWLNSRGNYRLYMLNENLHVLGFYVFDEMIWPYCPYQLCWGNGYLWGCFRDSWGAIFLGGKPSQYLYKFGRPYP